MTMIPAGFQMTKTSWYPYGLNLKATRIKGLSFYKLHILGEKNQEFMEEKPKQELPYIE